METQLEAMQESNRKADREHCQQLEQTKDAGSFPRLAQLIVHIEDLLYSRGLGPREISLSTMSRYYGRDHSQNATIRISDHDKGYPSQFVDFEGSILIREDMSEDEATELTEKALVNLAEFEEEEMQDT